MDRLDGKIALVTGSSRGIGQAIALALAGAGADVVVNYRTREADARKVEHEIRGIGRRSAAVRADVSSAADVRTLVDTAEQAIGLIDVLVNNAGVSRPQPMEAITERDWDELIGANLKSCFLLTLAVVDGMRKRRWGRIINLSSVAAQVGGVVGPHYAASKAGMLGLTHFYAMRLATEGVAVNAIAPALIETEMVTANPNASPARIPVGWFGAVDEVASVALMLATNAYITGQTINVNGSWFMS